MIVNICIIEKKNTIYLKAWLPKKAICFRKTSIKSSGTLHIVKYHYKNRYFSKIYTVLGTVSEPAPPENPGVTGSSK